MDYKRHFTVECVLLLVIHQVHFDHNINTFTLVAF